MGQPNGPSGRADTTVLGSACVARPLVLLRDAVSAVVCLAEIDGFVDNYSVLGV